MHGTRYELAFGQTVTDLTRHVEWRMREGWSLVGGPVHTPGAGWHQAMVK